MNIARPFKSVEASKTEDVDVEDKIRDMVRRDSAALREIETDAVKAAHDLGSLMGRVSGSSTREIDNLIDELKALRDKLHIDGTRVQREISDYAALTQSVMQLTKIISDGVTHVKSPDLAYSHPSEHRSPVAAGARDG